MAASPALGASAVKVDLGAIDTLPPARAGSAGAPLELTPPAAIRAEIARRAAARRTAEERAAARRITEERAAARRIAEARQRAEQSRRRAEAGRKEAEQRKMAADEQARKASEARARAAAQPKDLRKPAPKLAAKSANKSERMAPPAAGKPATGKPAGQTANRAPSAGKTRIAFAKGSTRLTVAARKNMAPIIESLSRNAGSRLVIYAYASGGKAGASGEKAGAGGGKARRLSLSRALAVRRHLIEAGIQGTRAEVRALGSNTTEKPLDRVDLVLVGR